MKTPNGGIKKTKQQRKEALFKKKRLRSVLTHKVFLATFHNICSFAVIKDFVCPQVQSIDMGLYPVDTDSSDDDLFTGNVWWEGGGSGEGGKENPGFEAGEEKQEGESKKEEEPPAE